MNSLEIRQLLDGLRLRGLDMRMVKGEEVSRSSVMGVGSGRAQRDEERAGRGVFRPKICLLAACLRVFLRFFDTNLKDIC